MADIHDILGFNFDASFFAGSASRGLDGSVIKKNMDRIRAFSDKLLDGNASVSAVDSAALMERIRAAFYSKSDFKDVLATRKELRSLSYNLDLSMELGLLKFTFSVIELHWSSSFFSGLIHCLLNNWGSADIECRKFLSGILYKAAYADKGLTSRIFLDCVPYLADDGPYKLGEYIHSQNQNFYSALSFFNLPRSRVSYSYFSDCIVGYFESASSNHLDRIEGILADHNNSATDKKLLSRLIVSFYNKKGSVPKDLRNCAMKRIGDPSIPSRWAPFDGATAKQIEDLSKAREIMMSIIAGEVINVFFRHLCQESNRKDFWLRHTRQIKDFRIYGPSMSKALMANYVEPAILLRHYNSITSTSMTCALVMDFGTHVIIEFSDVGALYAYKKDGDYFNRIFGKKTSFDNVSEMKIPEIPQLVDENSYYPTIQEEGRMVHSGYWTGRMERWLRKYNLL